MTEGLEKKRSVTDQQEMAIDMLVMGRRLTDVAEAVDISREQLWRWRNHDAGFMARLEEVQVEVHAARMSRFWALNDKAHDVLEESLEEGDPKAAMDILKLGARGLTDVTYISQPPTIAQLPEVSTSVVEPDGFACPDCDLVAKTERGLGIHRRARHPES